ncbi:MAG: dihydrolipoamide acetyltransferase family protein [Aestuariibaculum sp.]
MAKFELKLPKMGESVAEATITAWLKNVGDTIEAEETVLEVATDKVDSEVPCDVDGILVEKRFDVNDVVQVGQVLAIIEVEGELNEPQKTSIAETSEEKLEGASIQTSIKKVEETITIVKESVAPVVSNGDRFYSPLVKNIAKAEGLSQQELDTIKGSGKDGRVTKVDILSYIENRGQILHEQPLKSITPIESQKTEKPKSNVPQAVQQVTQSTISVQGDEIIEMTRMGKIISQHMVESVQTSVHVQSFIEADVTNIWNWRKKVKDVFAKREGENLTFTPIFMEVIAKALRDYPMMNISVQGDKIIKKKDINLGMAAALPDGNLIVPVIKNADRLNLVGMTKKVNDLAKRSRANQLKPDDIKDGTYTVTNVGSFGSITGTPIINQPQVGILALGAIRKMPAVIETPEGDFIGIRHKMILAHSYDHRVVNGALGGEFLKAVKDYLEAWDINREI